MYFESGFESGTLLVTDTPPGDWDLKEVTDGCSLLVERDAALHGAFGLRSRCNGVVNGCAYAEKALSTLSSCHARFEFGLAGWVPVAGPYDNIAMLTGNYGNTVNVAATKLGGLLSIKVSTVTDAGSASLTVPPMVPGTVVLQVWWKASSGPGADDGELRVWVFDEPVGQQTGLDNDTVRVTGVRVGHYYSRGAGGDLFIDGVAVDSAFVPAERHRQPLRLR